MFTDPLPFGALTLLVWRHAALFTSCIAR